MAGDVQTSRDAAPLDMAEADAAPLDAVGILRQMLRGQADLARQVLGSLAPPALDTVDDPEEALTDGLQWADVARRMQAMWLDHQAEVGQTARATNGVGNGVGSGVGDFSQLAGMVEGWVKQMPLGDPRRQLQLMERGFEAYRSVLGHFGIWPAGNDAPEAAPDLPRSDRRFADPLWREQPVFALLHQGYLLLAEELMTMADEAEGLEPAQQQQLVFTTRAIVDALSPANFPLTNPLALERARATRGESLIKGFGHLLSDMRQGRITQTPPDAFRIGENIATTPGKVVYETPLYQLIQYTPTTDTVARLPLVIFPAWINRFYILDLNPRKSLVRWAVAQGLTVFMVSWKSADETMTELTWDDYIAAQIDAVNVARERLKVPSVHTVGYCVAGTTLAATLAVLARTGEADRIASATFFTAQVDFADPGDLKHLVTPQTIDSLEQFTPAGLLDGRYLAASFNLLRGNDLIWNYVGKNYLMGEDYQPFDLLHWNADVANLPAEWHRGYARDLYRDNRLVIPDSLSAGGVPIDLRLIETPCYIQAGRDDHIAPAASVWKLTRQLKGPWTFQLAGSGHIAGVVNPPEAGKYGYWTNDGPADTLDAFVAGATEHPGSWWPHWRAWLGQWDSTQVPAKGKRVPGGRGDKVIEDAPGRYVAMR